MKSILIAAILLLPSAGLQAQVGSEPVRELLLPISSTVGGFGTQWIPSLIVLNDGDDTAEVQVDWQCSLPICPDRLTTLRVYDVSAAENPAVRVTASYMFDATGQRVAPGMIFFDEEIGLHGRSTLKPAEATLFNFLPTPDLDILVTIRPLDPEMRIWAFLSVTDNLSHDLVLYTPQTPAQ